VEGSPVTAGRRAYSYRTASEAYSVSVATLRRAVADGKIRTREAGGLILLHPDDLEKEYGFEPATPRRREPSAAARAELKDLLA
jgi:hypothetical protein